MSALALIEIDSSRRITHVKLEELSLQYAAVCANRSKQLILILTANRIDVIAALLGSWKAGHAVMLMDVTIKDDLLQRLLDLYRPDQIFAPNSYAPPYPYEKLHEIEGHALFARSSGSEIHQDLSLLLSTSGSTGSPKMVRLSKMNIERNTEAIIDALQINEEDCAAAHMPLSYSYGLSVVLTHLKAGASAALFSNGILEKSFWQAMREKKVTTLPGVPYHFSILKKLDLDHLNIPHLTTLTQAGGRMNPELVEHFARVMQKRAGYFFAMYGQTEAAPRMTVLPAERALDKSGSVGLPLAAGQISIEDEEIIYKGPNVMMGYAFCRSDLKVGDEMGERLATGDLGHVDSHGYLYITGRRGRFAKVDGLRIGLDELEKIAETLAPTAALEHQDQVVLFTTGEADKVRALVLSQSLLSPSRLSCRVIQEIPRQASGKTDMQALKGMLDVA